jgi:hypothetical protein
MMPCTCVICFFLLLVWFVKSWPDRERERERERERSQVWWTHMQSKLWQQRLFITTRLAIAYLPLVK